MGKIIFVDGEEMRYDPEKKWRYAVVGNIKKTHIDKEGILRHGTLTYKGNTKVYISGRLLEERLPDDNRTEITVLGISRGNRYYVESTPIDLIEYVRLTRVYSPRVLDIMYDREFEDGWWGNTQSERNDAVAFVKRWKEYYANERRI